MEVPSPYQHTFSYHHPSIPERKSRIDYIYTNIPNKSLCGYATRCCISDHYLISLFTLADGSIGLKQWKFPLDLLLDNNFSQQIHLVMDNFDKKDPVSS